MCEQETLGSEVEKNATFKRESGVIYKALEDTLQSINVKRQAYHSNSFVGNHIDICLKVGLVDKNKPYSLNTKLITLRNNVKPSYSH